MNGKLPKITVVTVTLNLIKVGRSEFFRQCVKSVHNQDYPNIEYLVIDGASTDGTLDLIKEYANKGWLTYISEPDTGLWDAMNKAIYRCSGDYLIYMNSDDYFYANDSITKSMNAIIKNKADYSYGACQILQRNSGKMGTILLPRSPALFYKDMTYIHETMICKTSLYKKYGGHNLKYKSVIDYYWNWILLLKDCKPVLLNDIITVKRTDGASSDDDWVISNLTPMYQDMFQDQSITSEVCKLMHQSHIFPEHLLDDFKERIINLHLKNFPYDEFIKDVNKTKKNKIIQISLFHVIPLMTIRREKNNIAYKLFNCIPLMIIKKNTYKLFGIIPFFKQKGK